MFAGQTKLGFKLKLLLFFLMNILAYKYNILHSFYAVSTRSLFFNFP